MPTPFSGPLTTKSILGLIAKYQLPTVLSRIGLSSPCQKKRVVSSGRKKPNSRDRLAPPFPIPGCRYGNPGSDLIPHVLKFSVGRNSGKCIKTDFKIFSKPVSDFKGFIGPTCLPGAGEVFASFESIITVQFKNGPFVLDRRRGVHLDFIIGLRKAWQAENQGQKQQIIFPQHKQDLVT